MKEEAINQAIKDFITFNKEFEKEVKSLRQAQESLERQNLLSNQAKNILPVHEVLENYKQITKNIEEMEAKKKELTIEVEKIDKEEKLCQPSIQHLKEEVNQLNREIISRKCDQEQLSEEFIKKQLKALEQELDKETKLSKKYHLPTSTNSKLTDLQQKVSSLQQQLKNKTKREEESDNLGKAIAEYQRKLQVAKESLQKKQKRETFSEEIRTLGLSLKEEEKNLEATQKTCPYLESKSDYKKTKENLEEKVNDFTNFKDKFFDIHKRCVLNSPEFSELAKRLNALNRFSDPISQKKAQTLNEILEELKNAKDFNAWSQAINHLGALSQNPDISARRKISILERLQYGFFSPKPTKKLAKECLKYKEDLQNFSEKWEGTKESLTEILSKQPH